MILGDRLVAKECQAVSQYIEIQNAGIVVKELHRNRLVLLSDSRTIRCWSNPRQPSAELGSCVGLGTRIAEEPLWLELGVPWDQLSLSSFLTIHTALHLSEQNQKMSTTFCLIRPGQQDGAHLAFNIARSARVWQPSRPQCWVLISYFLYSVQPRTLEPSDSVVIVFLIGHLLISRNLCENWPLVSGKPTLPYLLPTKVSKFIRRCVTVWVGCRWSLRVGSRSEAPGSEGLRLSKAPSEGSEPLGPSVWSVLFRILTSHFLRPAGGRR